MLSAKRTGVRVSSQTEPLDAKHELLYELLCLREKQLVDISARRSRGRVEDCASTRVVLKMAATSAVRKPSDR